MAEQLKRLSREDHEEAQRLIGLLTDGSSTVNKVNKGEYLQALTAYQQRVVAQLDAPNPEQAERIEKLAAEIQALREAAAESVPKDELERATTELSRVQKETEETGRRQEEALAKLRAELEEAQREDPRIADLTQQVQKLTVEKDGAVRLAEELRQRESSGETVPKAKFEEAQRRVEVLEKEIAELTPQLEKASGEENSRVVELKEQIVELESAHEQAILKQQQVVERLEADVQRLTHAAEDHPREIKEITLRADGEAEKAAALQLEMRRYQEVAVEVSRLLHDQAATKLEEAQRAHDAIEGETPQDEADKAFLLHKIALLEAKQAEHVAIQKNLVAAHQAGAEEALRSPELALERQSEILRAQRDQMAVYADILTTLGAGIGQRHALINAEYEKLTAARAKLGDVESQGVDVQLRALELDRQVAQLENQLQMLETLQGFEEIGRGQAGLGLTELHSVTSESLRVETKRLAGLRSAEARDEGAIAVQAEKVRGLEAQVEQLRAAVESYQDHAATQVAIAAQFLQKLVSIAPATVPAKEKLTFIWHAVEAIVAIQQRLAPEFKAEDVHHSRIKDLLQQIYTSNAEYLDITDSSVAELRGGVRDEFTRSLRYELPNILQTIVGYMQMPAANIEGEIVARKTEIARLEQEHGQLDAVRDHTRDERAIQANRAEFAIENIYLNTLLAIQGVHQPLRDAHAAEKTDPEWQKTVLGTMQRLIVGFFSMISSIPGMMIGGLQTMGHPLVSKK